MEKILYGAAYYYEYLPYDRLDEDIKMMTEANINLVRIGESTWSRYEPQEGVFDFASVQKVLDAMYAAGISVIVGTPTYAIPSWLAKKYPEVMVTDKTGKREYGARQIFDITHPTYRYFAERVIRSMLKETAKHPAVIGFQVDNETKHYDTSSQNVYIGFQKYLKEKFNKNIEKLNDAYGLDYWSNRINSWEDFPPINTTINGSFGAAFEEYKRKLVTEFLQWQVDIVKEYKQKDQFVTNNFDFEWRGQSYGIQPSVNHFETAKVFDVTAIDVYHPSQDDLTGIEIAFCGDIARSTKDQNYIVMETEAQAFKHWTPYPGQLRLQAYSHIASGACAIEYWHWHSIHNSFETYWKGLLSHDFKPNPVYNEAKQIGKELHEHSELFVGSKKRNKVAFLVSNNSLTAMDFFPYKGSLFEEKSGNHQYNDVFRAYYDALYKLNVEVDILDVEDERIDQYRLLIVPSLYAVAEKTLEKLNRFIRNGGNVLYAFRSGFSNEDVKVYTQTQPAIISEACGVEYQLFVEPKNVTISGTEQLPSIQQEKVFYWMELLNPTTAKVLAKYDHPYWGAYAAITENSYGKGHAYYVGAYINEATICSLYKYILQALKLESCRQKNKFPVINKTLLSKNGKLLDFYMNYSNESNKVEFSSAKGVSVFTEKKALRGETFDLKPWDLQIFIVENETNDPV